jgi:hypothetical protein
VIERIVAPHVAEFNLVVRKLKTFRFFHCCAQIKSTMILFNSDLRQHPMRSVYRPLQIKVDG